MPDVEALSERLDAVERALTDGDQHLPELKETADLTQEVETLSRRVESLDERLMELEAAVQAVRGYAGELRAVNEQVERRANAALAAVESLEAEELPSEQWDVNPVAWEDEAGREDGTTESGTAGRASETQRNDDGIVARVRDVL